MTAAKKSIANHIRELHSGLFPRRFEPSERDRKLLQLMYPSINWKNISFYDGLPWYMRHTFAFATALPNSYSAKRVNIYFKKYEPDDKYMLSTLVHEAFHVLQYSDLQKKWPLGFGFCRSFLWHYLGWFIALFFIGVFKTRKGVEKSAAAAYMEHPLEVPAYAQEWDFHQSYRNFGKHGALEILLFLQLTPQLIRQDSGYGQNRPPYWALLPAVFLSLIISLVKPFLDFLLLIVLSPILLLMGKDNN